MVPSHVRAITLLVIACFMPASIWGRSCSRYHDDLPRLVISWADAGESSTEVHTLAHPCLDWAIFGHYKAELLSENQLPEIVPYRNDPIKTVLRAELSKIINHLVDEIKTIKKRGSITLRDCIMLKDRNFNYQTSSGLVIVKLKNHPFVIKLFMENPHSFAHPCSKGMEPALFFLMSGGMSRFMAGLTRIPNMLAIRTKVEASPIWRDRIALPRKWFWVPEKNRHLHMAGYNMGSYPVESIDIPAVYAVICDEIKIERALSYASAQDRIDVLEFVRFIGNNRLDPNIPNYVIEKGTGKLCAIDTEHFGAFMGMREPLEYNGFFRHYFTLGCKFIRDGLFTSKRQHAEKRAHPINTDVSLSAG
jgi:hypothetical protein